MKHLARTLLASLLVAQTWAGCSLNPQPLPPGETQGDAAVPTNGGSTGSSSGGSSSGGSGSSSGSGMTGGPDAESEAAAPAADASVPPDAGQKADAGAGDSGEGGEGGETGDAGDAGLVDAPTDGSADAGDAAATSD